MRHVIAFVLALGLLAPGPARFPNLVSVGECSLDLLVGQSDRIVVARVDRIDKAPEGSEESTPDAWKLKLAHATVLETWKGKSDAPLVYRCSSSWTCDITSGEVGETVVLFLDATSEAAYCRVMDSGRGRLPVVENAGEKFATMWVGDVVLPLDTETFPGPDGRYYFIRNVKLDALRSITKAFVARRATLADMAEKSDAIVVGTIHTAQRDRKRLLGIDSFALEIEERWKGEIAESTIALRPPASWPTDLIPLAPGQRAVFLLTKPRADGKRDLVEDGLDVEGQLKTYQFLLFAFINAVGREEPAKSETHWRWMQETERRHAFRAIWQKYFETHGESVNQLDVVPPTLPVLERLGDAVIVHPSIELPIPRFRDQSWMEAKSRRIDFRLCIAREIAHLARDSFRQLDVLIA
jgi:hypothetical protein